MREQESEAVICLCCGARAGAAVKARVVTARWDDELDRVGRLERASAPAPKRRSGLAYAAGYSGLACLLAFGLGPPANWGLGFTVLGSYGVPRFIPLWGLWAPVALVLSVVAARSIDRSRDVEGALPALVGFVVGLCGTGLMALHVMVPGGLAGLP